MSASKRILLLTYPMISGNANGQSNGSTPFTGGSSGSNASASAQSNTSTNQQTTQQQAQQPTQNSEDMIDKITKEFMIIVKAGIKEIKAGNATVDDVVKQLNDRL